MGISWSSRGPRGSPASLATVLGAGSVVLFAAVVSATLILGVWEDDEALGPMLFSLLTVLYAVIGVAIARRDPGNVIGWIFIALSLWVSSMAAVEFTLSVSGLSEAAEVIGHSAWALPIVVPAVWVPLIFPDGRALTPRWRVLFILAVIGTLGFVLQNAFGEFLGGAEEYGPNPVHIQLVDRISWLVAPLLILSLFASVASAVVRFRRADAVERQQVKWLAFGAIVVLITWFACGALTEVGVLSLEVADLLLLVSTVFIPVAIALAIVRYRLYDIDRLISRSVSYALIVPILGSIYVTGAVWLPTRLSNDSPVFVAGSTLLVAALFNPIRRRVMRWVDQRFYRSRYVAEEISDEFARQLRDQVDPELLAEHWTTAVLATMHPSSLGIWMRGEHG